MIRLILFLLIFFLPTVLFAKKIEVNYAGFSYLGNNESQFSGYPGGYRGNDGKFYFKGQNGYWWILSEPKSKGVFCCNLNSKYDFLIRLTAEKENGFSVRCIK